MAKLAFLLALILLLFPIASATEISSYDLEATIDKSVVNEQALLFIKNTGEKSVEILLPPSIKNLEANINDVPMICSKKEIVGFTKISCPVNIEDDYFIKLYFDTTFPIVSLNGKTLFSQHLDFNSTIKKFVFRLKLPERAILPEEASKFITPEPAKIYSDGRRIILYYEIANANKFDNSAIYEPVKETPVAPFIAIFFLVLIAVGFLLARKKRKPKTAEKIIEEKTEIPKDAVKEAPKEELHLLPDEKNIIDMLKQASEPTRQRDIQRQVTFSKAKLSRVLRGLEERGIIKRTPKGNTNLVELIKV